MLVDHAKAELENLERLLVKHRDAGRIDDAIMVAAEMFDLQREFNIDRSYGLFRTLFSKKSMRRRERPSTRTPEALMINDAAILATMPLAVYQTTPFWKEVERATRARSAGACEVCGVAGGRLIVRHTKQGAANRGMEQPDDTEAVCVECAGA